MLEAVVDWTGFTGAPGNSVFYFTEPSGDPPLALHTFFNDIAAELPQAVTIAIPSEGRRIDPAEGDLLGTWAAPAQPNVDGTALGSYAAPAGVIARWNTQGVVANRFVRGRTFLVPVASSVYQTDGTINPTDLGELQSAADALVASLSADLVVWSRPLFDRTDPANPVLVRAGTEHVVETATVPDKVAILTSRRD